MKTRRASDPVAAAEAAARAIPERTKCRTCKYGEPIGSVVRHLNDMRLGGAHGVSVEWMRQYLKKKHGYKPTVSALWEHVRRCLGGDRAK